MNSKIASPRFDGASVLTIGDTMLDRYWHGSTNRISAEAPIAVVDINETEERLGGAANVALNIAALGAQASLVGAIGDDDSGRIVSSKLATAGIQDLLKVFPDLPTITKYRIVSRKQQLVRADFEKVQDIDASHFTSRVDAGISNSDVVVLSDYDKGVLASPAAFIQAARAQAKPVLVDPKFKDFSAYAGATLVKPNQKEFVSAVGQWQTEAEMVDKCQKMMATLGFEAMLITRGSEGMTLVQKGQQPHHLPAQNRDVYDVSGAGDTVIAVMATALAAGMTLIDAMMLSNIAAGIVVGRLGTDSVSGPELRLAVDEVSGNQGVMSEEQLLIALNEARSRGEKVVFTNGCFDILHAGHVDYLKEARQEGDRLIVAINDDQSVHKLKGEGRPINALDRRLTMLAGLASVDWVLSFSGDTPEALLETFKPDVLVKGGDYRIDEVVGADIVRGYGGDVKILKLVDGLSTTSLAEKIKRL